MKDIDKALAVDVRAACRINCLSCCASILATRGRMMRACMDWPKDGSSGTICFANSRCLPAA
jgi:hypothetical protein